VAALSLGDRVLAADAFGFTFGMNRDAVLKTAKDKGMGVLIETKLFPNELNTSADVTAHNCSFDFCEDKLYSVVQIFPRNLREMAQFVDDTILFYGQPVIVKALKREGIGITWKVNDTTYVRLSEFGDDYAIDYRNENPCVKISP
jgi:hypothetical protein